MKSERRHELEHNELKDWLTKGGETMAPYANVILGAVLVVVVLAGAVLLWNKFSHAEQAKAWREFYEAQGSEQKLAGFVDEHTHDEAGKMAAIVLGDNMLRDGSLRLFQDRVQGESELRQAIDHYNSVLQATSKIALRQRATFGLARAHEALGDLKKALEIYRQTAKQWPDSLYAIQSNDRIADLELQSTKVMYDKLASYNPQPAPTPGSDRKPLFDSSLPPEPPVEPGRELDLKFDTSIDKKLGLEPVKPATEGAKEEKPAAEEPAAKP